MPAPRRPRKCPPRAPKRDKCAADARLGYVNRRTDVLNLKEFNTVRQTAVACCIKVASQSMLHRMRFSGFAGAEDNRHSRKGDGCL